MNTKITNQAAHVTDTAQIAPPEPMSQFRKSLISGCFAFVAVVVVAAAIGWAASAIGLTAGGLPSIRVVQGVLVIASLSFIFLAWKQWNNHITDTRHDFWDRMELRWGIDLNGDGEIGARAVPTVEPIIGRVEVHNGGVTTIPYPIPITATQAAEVLDVLQKGEWKYSRVRFVPRIMSQKPSDELGKMHRELGLYEPNSNKLNEYGRALWSGLPHM